MLPFVSYVYLVVSLACKPNKPHPSISVGLHTRMEAPAPAHLRRPLTGAMFQQERGSTDAMGAREAAIHGSVG